jgi:hypothetical protein
VLHGEIAHQRVPLTVSGSAQRALPHQLGPPRPLVPGVEPHNQQLRNAGVLRDLDVVSLEILVPPTIRRLVGDESQTESTPSLRRRGTRAWLP